MFVDSLFYVRRIRSKIDDVVLDPSWRSLLPGDKVINRSDVLMKKFEIVSNYQEKILCIGPYANIFGYGLFKLITSSAHGAFP